MAMAGYGRSMLTHLEDMAHCETTFILDTSSRGAGLAREKLSSKSPHSSSASLQKPTSIARIDSLQDLTSQTEVDELQNVYEVTHSAACDFAGFCCVNASQIFKERKI